jgi:DNA-binding response OmpR family regulator
MNKKVLVIDKDPAIIDIITFMLKDEGYDFLVSQKPFNLQEVKEYNPALILLHNGLNNEGSVICKLIKSCSNTEHIPIIMSSTRNDLPQIAQDSCADAYIQKPFDINEFLLLILQALIIA